MLNKKKGIVLDFLVTLILALIIFIPACMFSSSLFRLSDQAQSSFLDLAKEIEKVSDDDNLKSSSLIFTIDEESFILLFSNNKAETKGKLFLMDKENQQFSYAYPEFQCQKEGKSEPCLCLCREYEIKESELICNDLRCEVIDNTVIKESWGLWRYDKDFSRRHTLIIKEGDLGEITVIGDQNQITEQQIVSPEEQPVKDTVSEENKQFAKKILSEDPSSK